MFLIVCPFGASCLFFGAGFFARLGFARSLGGSGGPLLCGLGFAALTGFFGFAARLFGLAARLFCTTTGFLRFALGFLGFATRLGFGTTGSLEGFALFFGGTATGFLSTAPFFFGALAAGLFFAAALFGLANFFLNEAVDLVVEGGVACLLCGDSGLQLALLAAQVVDHTLLFALLSLESGLLLAPSGEKRAFGVAFARQLLTFAANHGFALCNGQSLRTLVARIFLGIAYAAIHLVEVARREDEHQLVLCESIAIHEDDAARITATAFVELAFEGLQLRLVSADAAVEGVEVVTNAADHALLVRDLAVDGLQVGESRRHALPRGREFARVFVHLSLQIGFFALQLADAGRVRGGSLRLVLARLGAAAVVRRLFALIAALSGGGSGIFRRRGAFLRGSSGFGRGFLRLLFPFVAVATSHVGLLPRSHRNRRHTEGKKQQEDEQRKEEMTHGEKNYLTILIIRANTLESMGL